MTSPKPSRRKKANLTPNNETFRLLFANHPIPMWIYDLKTLAFLEVNDAALEKYGYTRDEFQTLTIKDIRPAEDVERLINILEQKRPSFHHTGKWRHCLKNGQVIDVEITRHTLDFEGQKAVLVMAQDITERKQAEEALRESEDKFKYFFEYSAIGKSITLLSDGMNANQALCDLLGYTQAELKSKKWQEITHPDDIELTQKEIDQLISGEQNSVRFNKRFIHKNGHVVWVDLSSSLRRDKDGKPLYLMSSVIDITERKRAEDELKESQKRFATIFRANPAAIAMTRLDDGQLVDVNAAWQRMTGYVHTEVVGRTPQELNLWGHPEEQERLIEMLGEQGKAHGEVELRQKSGEIRDMLMSAELIELAGKRYLLTMAQDVTESKRVADIIRKKNQMLLALQNVALEIGAELQLPILLESILQHAQSMLNADRGGGIYLYDAGENVMKLAQGSGINQGREGITVQMDKGVVGDVFRTAQPLVIGDYTHWEGRATVLIADPPSTVMGVPLFLNNQIAGVLTLIANSHLRKFNEQDVQQAEMFAAQASIGIRNAQHYQQAQQETSERKRAEEALAKSEKKLRTLFETMSEGIVYEDHDGKIISANPAAERLLGLSFDQMQGRTSVDLRWKAIHADGSPFPGETHSLNVAAKTGKPATGEVMGIYNPKSDAYVWLSVNSTPEFLTGEKKPFQAYAVFRDITERKRAEDVLKEYNARLETAVELRTSELRETQEKLVRQEKLAVLGQLAGSVGHELRNPLAVINNALYYLKLVGADSSEKVKEYLGIIQTEAHTAEKIITDLLDFARIKSVDVEAVSAFRLVERVFERYPAPNSVNVTLEIPADLPMLYVDPRQMEQVLGNLIINACQAMTIGGDSTGGKLTITARQEQEMIAIVVKDTGVGISPENMKKLFEPLFTTKAKGIGLGLAVSQKLVEANGGRIEVQSEAGKGSTFTVYLPVKQ